MGKTRTPKAVAGAVNNAKKKAEAEPQGGALRRAAKAREKASAREKKVQGNIHKRSSQLDAALMTLEKTDVGSPQARKVEKAVRAALKALLVQRKKLRKAGKARRRAEVKERKTHDRVAAPAAKAARAKAPAARSRKASKKRPAKNRQAKPRATRSATKPTARDTMPATEVVSRVDAGALRESAGAPSATPLSAVHRSAQGDG